MHMNDQISTQSRRGSLVHALRNLRRNQSGVAMIEFAFSIPIFMGLGMYGTESAFMAMANLKLSQTALNLADNASRLGQTDNGIATPTIKELDVNQALAGAGVQSEEINMLPNGRVILSSLEVTSGGQQFIRWQRCLGKRNVASRYSDDIAPKDGTVDTSFTGMGASTAKVQASNGSAVMFVEVEYVYQPLFKNLFVGTKVLRQEAAFNIRDDRNTTAGLANDVTSAKKKTCDKFTVS